MPEEPTPNEKGRFRIELGDGVNVTLTELDKHGERITLSARQFGTEFWCVQMYAKTVASGVIPMLHMKITRSNST